MNEEKNDALCLGKKAPIICIFSAQGTKKRAKYRAESMVSQSNLPTWDLDSETLKKLINHNSLPKNTNSTFFQIVLLRHVIQSILWKNTRILLRNYNP